MYEEQLISSIWSFYILSLYKIYINDFEKKKQVCTLSIDQCLRKYEQEEIW